MVSSCLAELELVGREEERVSEWAVLSGIHVRRRDGDGDGRM